MQNTRAIGFALATSVSILASAGHAATATLKNTEGVDVGSVTLTEMATGVLLEVNLNGLPAGVHGFHIHQTGSCTPDFGAAGGHFAGGDRQHGLKVDGGPHAGDMPNIHIPDSGTLLVEVFNTAISFHNGDGALFDDDGSAIVIHGGSDDYESQPSGSAGNRLACGVIVE